jgi:hypothetical protein
MSETMESIEPGETNLEQFGGSSHDKSDSFFKYITTFTNNDKYEIINISQYLVLAIIPVVVILLLFKKYMPIEDPDKNTIEISLEVLIQLVLVFTLFWLTHKIILFIPTYSGAPYKSVNVLNMIMPILFILFTMDTSISEKVNILLKRFLIIIGLEKENMEVKNESQETINTPTAMMLPPPAVQQMMPGVSSNEMAGNQTVNTSTTNLSNLNAVPMNPMAMGGSEPMAANEMGGSWYGGCGL